LLVGLLLVLPLFVIDPENGEKKDSKPGMIVSTLKVHSNSLCQIQGDRVGCTATEHIIYLRLANRDRHRDHILKKKSFRNIQWTSGQDARGEIGFWAPEQVWEHTKGSNVSFMGEIDVMKSPT